MRLILENEAQTLALGAKVAGGLQGGERIYLRGDLGAGKTTLVRGVLNTLGYAGHVKSPTYTLLESYVVAGHDIYHFDLYRINDPEELEVIGIRDYCDSCAICFFEWPEQGKTVLPPADIILSLTDCDVGRGIEIKSCSPAGEIILQGLGPLH